VLEGSIDGSQHEEHGSVGKSSVKVIEGGSEIVVPPMMVRYSSTFKFYWDIVIIILALFISIVLPIEIAFNPPFLFTSAEIAIESIINLVFMIDIFINFRNTFVSTQSGDEVFSQKDIAVRYIFGNFFLDIISSIPFNSIGNPSSPLPLLGMFKLVRVGKINTIIRNLNIGTGSKATLRVLWLIFFLFLFNHVIGCIWFYIASLE
jgi:hypothetical protein